MPKLTQTEQQYLERVFDIPRGRGYVLDFSDRTFQQFFDEELNIDIYDARYEVFGTSKGKRLNACIAQASGAEAARILRALWEHYCGYMDLTGGTITPILEQNFFKVVHRMEGDTEIPNTDALDRFIPNETLDELLASIKRDMEANKPQAALDRVHTYCMKKFAHLLQVRGVSCDREEPLHSRVGKYIKQLETEGRLLGMSLTIMKSSISMFEKFNDVRNNRSFAHDNEITEAVEARFIFDSISGALRFVRTIETGRFGD